MNEKNLLIAMIIWGGCLAKVGYADNNPDGSPAANTPYTPPAANKTYVAPTNTITRKPVQFYAGLSGGIEQMTGKRTDLANEDNGAGGRVLTYFSNNQNTRENNASVSVLGGFWWHAVGPVLLGPEVFFGRGNTNSYLKDSRFDDTSAATRAYSFNFQRKLSYGALVKAGYHFCQKYTAYLSAGYDRGQFSSNMLFAVDPATPAPGTPTTFGNNTKWLNGFLFGLGIEKKIDSFTVGLDFRVTQYQKYNVTYGLAVPVAILPGTLTFSVRPKIYQGLLRISYNF